MAGRTARREILAAADEHGWRQGLVYDGRWFELKRDCDSADLTIEFDQSGRVRSAHSYKLRFCVARHDVNKRVAVLETLSAGPSPVN